MLNNYVLITDFPENTDSLLSLLLVANLHKQKLIDLKGVVVNRNRNYRVVERANIARWFLDNLGLEEITVGIGDECQEEYLSTSGKLDSESCKPRLDFYRRQKTKAMVLWNHLRSYNQKIHFISVSPLVDLAKAMPMLVNRVESVTFSGSMQQINGMIIPDLNSQNVKSGLIKLSEGQGVWDTTQDVFDLAMERSIDFRTVSETINGQTALNYKDLFAPLVHSNSPIHRYIESKASTELGLSPESELSKGESFQGSIPIPKLLTTMFSIPRLRSAWFIPKRLYAVNGFVEMADGVESISSVKFPHLLIKALPGLLFPDLLGLY